MFRIKICGVTSADDARAAVDCGADAIGLNFYAGSPRFLEPGGAETIVRALPSPVVKVGVFVNASAEKVIRTCDQLGLDLIQLHGDEPPEFLTELEGRAVMRAFRFGEDGIMPIARYLERATQLNCLPRLVMMDADRKGTYGGTGQAIDWQRLSNEKSQLGELPLVLAGGLNAENVGDAIRTVRPAAVDTASGVESSAGCKDLAKMRSYMAAARQAFDALDEESKIP